MDVNLMKIVSMRTPVYMYPQGESVEDCSGVVSEGVGNVEFPTGYCREPPDGTLVIITQEDISGTTLQKCQGDCHHDEDCAGNLKCFLREGSELVPGRDSANAGVGWFDHDYCYDATGFLHFVHDGLPEGSYGLCEGDCDSDVDCIGDLVCFYRNGGEQVPGCNDPYNNIIVHEDINFCCDPNVEGCGDPPAGEFELISIGNDGYDIFPLPICRGDCDNDDDCQGALRCFQREGGEEVPGCTGSPSIPDNYCGDATGIMFWVSGNEGDVPIVPFNDKDADLVLKTGLLACMGNCDSSSDCAEGFLCYNREPGDDTPAPGCQLWGDPNVIDNINFCCDQRVPGCTEGAIENPSDSTMSLALRTSSTNSSTSDMTTAYTRQYSPKIDSCNEVGMFNCTINITIEMDPRLLSWTLIDFNPSSKDQVAMLVQSSSSSSDENTNDKNNLNILLKKGPYTNQDDYDMGEADGVGVVKKNICVSPTACLALDLVVIRRGEEGKRIVNIPPFLKIFIWKVWMKQWKRMAWFKYI